MSLVKQAQQWPMIRSANQGTYKVTLRVVDDSNESSETTITVTITNPPEGN
jgi:hypothetical protein